MVLLGGITLETPLIEKIIFLSSLIFGNFVKDVGL